jgi:Ras-related protein Rab-5C
MDEDAPIKVVLLGETAVGKSCLITRFVNDSFQSNHVSTMVGVFQSKTVFYDKLNKQIKYEIWDTAGQEKYRSLNKMFYNNADVVILVVDITRKETFEAIKDFWYNEVKDNSPENVILALAANKCDLYEYEEITNQELNDYAKNINAIYKQTSALQNSGINDLFDAIGYKILSPENFDEFIRKSTSKKQLILSSSGFISINVISNS